MHNQHTNVDGVSITMLQNSKIIASKQFMYVETDSKAKIQRIFHNTNVQNG